MNYIKQNHDNFLNIGQRILEFELTIQRDELKLTWYLVFVIRIPYFDDEVTWKYVIKGALESGIKHTN
jgi:hypothetical protein